MSAAPRHRRRPLLRLAALALPGAALAATATVAAPPAGADGTPAPRPQPLRVNGSGGALEGVRQVGHVFAASPGGVPLAIGPALGTAGAHAALAAGRLDLCIAGRPPGPAESRAGVWSRAYARTPIAFVAHPGAPAPRAGLATDDAARLLSGEVTSWPGGAPVRVIRRPPTEALFVTLAEQSPVLARALERLRDRPGLLTAGSDGENADLLEALPGSFGILPFGQLVAEGRRLRALPLDGVGPGTDALATGRYPFGKTLYVVLPPRPRPEAAAFADYLFGPIGRIVLEGLGCLLPPPPGSPDDAEEGGT